MLEGLFTFLKCAADDDKGQERPSSKKAELGCKVDKVYQEVDEKGQGRSLHKYLQRANCKTENCVRKTQTKKMIIILAKIMMIHDFMSTL